MVKRLPTGLIIELPSGVKTRFPQRYIVPNKLENCVKNELLVRTLK